MYYHPLIGIIIFFVAIVVAFFLGKFAYKRYKHSTEYSNLELLKSKNRSSSSPPQGEITAPDAPWLKK